MPSKYAMLMVYLYCHKYANLGARLAARCAVRGAVDHLNAAIEGSRFETTTVRIVVGSDRSFSPERIDGPSGTRTKQTDRSFP